MDARKYAHFAFGLRRFLHTAMSLDEARRTLDRFLEHRETHFLSVMEKAIYPHEQNPYRRLLQRADISFDDLRDSVTSSGVEGTLAHLRDAGVFLTIDEFKGRVPICRPGMDFAASPTDFDNPYLAHYFTGATGASRSPGTRTMIDLDFITDRAPANALLLQAHDALQLPFFIWFPILPGIAGLRALLQNAKIGEYAVQWFTQVASRNVRPSWVNRLGTSYILTMSRIFGVRLPGPQFVPLTDPLPVAQALAEAARRQGGARITTFASSAARLCRTAKQAGLDLSGVCIQIGGEPLTAARVEEIRAVGARPIHLYYSVETGIVGAACATATAHDDLHLFHDGLAVVTHQRTIPGTSTAVDSFLFTSLLPSAPKILLNVELGDSGTLETYPCGCALGKLGLTHHLRKVRSFEKLTGEGMTLLGTDLIRVLEEVALPQFGGTTTDYQFVQSNVQGATPITLRIRPSLGKLDEQRLLTTLLERLAQESDGNDLARAVWMQIGALVVERADPIPTARGKILPLYIQHE
ncbi:MAG: hypothetical protein GXP41_05745 [Chloroflexi bacterium]|nr:hypothetical protein [Chloroflexota bacterium]